MTSDQSLRERSDPAADPLRTASQARSPAGPGDAGDGGDPACWACLVCEECGAVVSEGHRAGCSHSSQPAGPLRAGSRAAGLPGGKPTAVEDPRARNPVTAPAAAARASSCQCRERIPSGHVRALQRAPSRLPDPPARAMTIRSALAAHHAQHWLPARRGPRARRAARPAPERSSAGSSRESSSATWLANKALIAAACAALAAGGAGSPSLPVIDARTRCSLISACTSRLAS